jgi:hypothetical protein
VADFPWSADEVDDSTPNVARMYDYFLGGFHNFAAGRELAERAITDEIAQQLAPDTRVVYVDVEPVAVTHSRNILRDNPKATVVRGALRRPREVLADPGLVLVEQRQPGGPCEIENPDANPDENPEWCPVWAGIGRVR